jgi:gluconokinase
VRPVVVGLDVGTTNAKAVAFDSGGERGAEAAVSYELYEPEPGAAVQDPAVVVDAAVKALERVAGATRPVVACSTAMHGLVALDEHDRPLTPLIT